MTINNELNFISSENSSLKPSPEILKAEKTLLLHIQMELCSKTRRSYDSFGLLYLK
jgi:hypothetical protein